MAVLTALGVDEVKGLITTFRDALASHRELINRLNVYPVPDGDTGTNMTLTLESVIEEIEGAAADDLEATCAAISHGSLMGARGNSGVILSQVLRGIASTFSSGVEIGGTVFATALTEASGAAYNAVMKPVEGTILTVVREASEAATAAVEAGKDQLVDVLDAARARAVDALERTPEMLPVLKEAGVVDAGGAGFVLLLDAALSVVDGRPLPEPADDVAADLVAGFERPDYHEDDVSDLRYEVMFFLDADDVNIAGLKDVWAGVGDSIVVVGGDGIWNCHVHTNDIGAAIEAGIQVGRPHKIRVTDLAEEVAEERWVREAAARAGDEPVVDRQQVGCAVVAVSPADGIGRIFHSLGVQELVTGGQTMNPSTADLLTAVRRAPSEMVVILPNNKNIIPVAKQVDENTTKTVVVVPTTSVAEGFASLLAYDPAADADSNAEGMTEIADGVVVGEVTQAVRDSSSDAGPVKEGDWIGLDRTGIRVVRGDMTEAAIRLLDHIVDDDHEIVSIIEGSDAGPPETRPIREWLVEHRPGVEVEVHKGGQRHYPYYFGIE
ncbi:MAG: DAK2 domain-containing protein [Actinomycetia bacterium]|nr:DAK2 domain-containing protein [Actinomycetes bacterium]MCP4963547.1 DAK2 domain-containing protein [Actinomycetes bacterium]